MVLIKVIKLSLIKWDGDSMDICYSFVNDQIKKHLVQYRRDFHRNPELGWLEVRTTEVIAKHLNELGYEVYVGEAVCDMDSRLDVQKDMTTCTGVIGILRGKNSNKKVAAFRFDMDALPIQEAKTEKNDRYCSTNNGVMHACGHDGHMAVGLALAEIFKHNQEQIEGEIRLIFQPAEEGCKGAKSVVAKGWLDDVDEFYSGHIGIGCRELGQIGACMRGFLASTKLNIYFHGRAAHAANAPEQGRNALLAAADFIVRVYAFYKTCSEDTRMNVGRLISGSARNIIADEAYLEVETRGQTSKSNQSLYENISRIAKETADVYGVTCEIITVGDVGTGKSDRELAVCGYDIACDMGIGEKYKKDAVFNASEDVVTMMNYVQNCGGKAAYFMFGTELTAEHHHPCFDFDEEVLSVMTEFYAKVLLKNKIGHTIMDKYDV